MESQTPETKTETAVEKKNEFVEKQIMLITGNESLETKLPACKNLLDKFNEIELGKKETIMDSLCDIVKEIGQREIDVNKARQERSSGTIGDMGERAETGVGPSDKETIVKLYGKLADRPDLVNNAFNIATSPDFYESVKKTESLAA